MNIKEYTQKRSKYVITKFNNQSKIIANMNFTVYRWYVRNVNEQASNHPLYFTSKIQRETLKWYFVVSSIEKQTIANLDRGENSVVTQCQIIFEKYASPNLFQYVVVVTIASDWLLVTTLHQIHAQKFRCLLREGSQSFDNITDMLISS